MAVYYFLAVECGEKRNAKNLSLFFDKKELTLSDGGKVPLSSGYIKDKTGNWWVEVNPKGVSIGSPMGSDYRLYDYFIAEITQKLYGLLKEAPPFRYALAGHEVEFFVYFEDMEQSIKEGSWEGLIISEELWENFNKPEDFEPFSKGYVWQAYSEFTQMGQAYWFDKYVCLKEFKVNDFITLKLENGDSNIFVNGELVLQCRHLLTNILKSPEAIIVGFSSVDELEELYNDSSYSTEDGQEFISLDEEFWGHCSNIQAWVENQYDTNLLDMVLAFPILHKLSELGDMEAKHILNTEIIKRIKSDFLPVILFLIDGAYLRSFQEEELLHLIDYLKLFVSKMPSKEQGQINAQISEAFRSSFYHNEKFRAHKVDIKILKIALEFNPRNNYALYEAGLSHYFINDYETAESYFKKALSVDSKDTVTLGVYGDLLIKEKRYDDVKDLFEPIIEDISEYSRLRYLLGKVYYETGDLEKALTYLKISIEHYPYNDDANELKARIEKELNVK